MDTWNPESNLGDASKRTLPYRDRLRRIPSLTKDRV